MTRGIHRHTSRGQALQGSQSRAATRTDDSPEPGTALLDPNGQRDGRRQRSARARRAPSTQQSMETRGRAGGAKDTGPLPWTLDQRKLRGRDAALPQSYPHARSRDGEGERTEHSRRAGENTHNRVTDAGVPRQQREYEDQYIAGYIAKLVDSAPRLTDAQRNRIAAVLQAGNAS